MTDLVTPAEWGAPLAAIGGGALYARHAHPAAYWSGPDGLLFVREKGVAFRRTSFGRKWRRAHIAAGLPDGFRFYDLRHTGHTLSTRSGLERQSSEAVATAHMASSRMRWSASSILLRGGDPLGLADEREKVVGDVAGRVGELPFRRPSGPPTIPSVPRPPASSCPATATASAAPPAHAPLRTVPRPRPPHPPRPIARPPRRRRPPPDPPDPPVRRFPSRRGRPTARAQPLRLPRGAVGGGGPGTARPTGRPLRLAALHEPGGARSY